VTQQVRVAAIQAEPRWRDLAAGIDLRVVDHTAGASRRARRGCAGVAVGFRAQFARAVFPATGERRMGLSVTDRSETGLKGDVVNRHDLLGKLRDFYVNGPANPVRRSPPARHRQTRHRQRTARCTEP
jgi:hypothetical protein